MPTTDVSYDGLLLVAAVAFAAPFVLGLFPRLRLPSVVLEIVLGIVIGPSVLGWVEIDAPIQVLSLIGLAFLLFLAGLEIELEHLRGRLLRLAAGGWAISFALAVVAGFILQGAGLVDSPVLVGIILSATSLGIIIPVLKDAGEIASPSVSSSSPPARSPTSARSSCSASSSRARAASARRCSCSACWPASRAPCSSRPGASRWRASCV